MIKLIKNNFYLKIALFLQRLNFFCYPFNILHLKEEMFNMVISTHAHILESGPIIKDVIEAALIVVLSAITESII